MTEDELKAIEARARDVRTMPSELEEDVLALVAEVRRLRHVIEYAQGVEGEDIEKAWAHDRGMYTPEDVRRAAETGRENADALARKVAALTPEERAALSREAHAGIITDDPYAPATPEQRNAAKHYMTHPLRKPK